MENLFLSALGNSNRIVASAVGELVCRIPLRNAKLRLMLVVQLDVKKVFCCSCVVGGLVFFNNVLSLVYALQRLFLVSLQLRQKEFVPCFSFCQSVLFQLGSEAPRHPWLLSVGLLEQGRLPLGLEQLIL